MMEKNLQRRNDIDILITRNAYNEYKKVHISNLVQRK